MSVKVQKSYECNVGRVKFSTEYAIEHTDLPLDPEKIPHIIGWSGPARSGTTALLFLLSNHPAIDRLYFQPYKTLMRTGEPNFALRPQDKLVCMKEVYGQCFDEEMYDPVDMLLRAGVPSSRITWITLLRDPLQTFASWHYYYPESTPEMFEQVVTHTIKQYSSYVDLGIKAIPFAYDLLEGRETSVISTLLAKVHLSSQNINMAFQPDAIEKKFIAGQAENKEYFFRTVAPIKARKGFEYSKNDYPLSASLADTVNARCGSLFSAFVDESCEYLGMTR